MRPEQIAVKYTLALRATLHTEEDLHRTVATYQQFMTICGKEPDLLRTLSNSIVPLDHRKQLLETALSICNPPPSLTALAFLLLERNRFSLLPVIARQFEQQMDQWLNRVEVEVITAIPLSAELFQKVHHTMELFTKKTVRLVQSIDPDIIGGLIIKMEGLAMDFSYRARLEKLREKLLSEGRKIHGA